MKITNIKIILCLLLFTMESWGQVEPLSKDSVQNFFKAGKIVSLKDGIACYRLNGIQGHSVYGYCFFDKDYQSGISSQGHTWSKNQGMVEIYTNSKCYTIIAPFFDYAQPFSEGWGAVCKDGKWSYVSCDGNLMCEFILDTAYPFKNGKAKVMYKNQNFEIDTHGNGLPSEINRDTHSLSRQLQAHTINQLYEEHQYEKTIEKGNKLYNDILECKSKFHDVCAKDLISAVQAEYAAVSAQNSLLAQLQNSPQLFDYYQDIDLNRRFSVESGHYELNCYNSEPYLNLFKEKYKSDSLVSNMLYQVEDLNYKQAILLFEKWLRQKNISVSGSPIELMVYYYLAELSNDFETANVILLSIAKLYENRGFDWIDDDYMLGCLLFNIRKYKSAKTSFEHCKKKNNKNDTIKEIFCDYNLAQLHCLAGDDEQCKKHYLHAFNTIKNSKTNILPEEMKNGLMADFIDFLINRNLWNSSYDYILEYYTQSEIDFNIEQFISNDVLHTNRIWGRSLARIQKILQHLDHCSDKNFLKRAFVITVFQQSIAHDAEKAFLMGLKNTTNIVTKKLIAEYLQLKKDYKGFDLFDAGEYDIKNKNVVLRLSEIEKDIRKQLLDDGCMSLKNVYMSPLDGIKVNDVAIDVVEYSKNVTIKKYGVFAIKGNMLNFIPLGKEQRFLSKDFWPIITNEFNIGANNDCYLYAGKLDDKGLEYEKCDDGTIAYFKYNLHRVSSLTNINKKRGSSAFKDIALFGGLDYGEELVAKSRGAVDNGFLEYSKKEVDAIADILNSKMNVFVLSEKNGTSERFLSYSTSATDIIHLATHGYQKDLKTIKWTNFENHANMERFNYYRQNTDLESLEWLMNYTGLFFSINDKDTTNILYSREVASCDFSNTKLVVLSACSTMAGRMSDNYSGGISLTTAFTIAQAQNIVTSLYDVDDEKTYEFMTLFYARLKATDNVYMSFKNTVKVMRDRYPNHKELWGAFILLENF